MRLVAQAKQQGMFSDEALGAVVPVAEPRAPVLGLLGDIGDPFTEVYRRFLEIQATRFDLVLVLSGNHEYYNNFDLTAGGSTAVMAAVTPSRPLLGEQWQRCRPRSAQCVTTALRTSSTLTKDRV